LKTTYGVFYIEKMEIKKNDNTFFLRFGCARVSKCTPLGRVPVKNKERKRRHTAQIKNIFTRHMDDKQHIKILLRNTQNILNKEYEDKNMEYRE
jgi:hypothetical protein